ncbi:MAG: hypothetical protein NT081_00355 [Actinobacteria bacterium]|nr:hypothetical protein [Actinomycetota bacterium]
MDSGTTAAQQPNNQTVDESSGSRNGSDQFDRDLTVRWLAAVLSLTAGAVHFGYAPHHLSEDWAHGWFFLLIAAYQCAFAVLIVARPRRWVWASAIIINVGIIATWVVSRTVGLPFGPEALRSEVFSAPDIVSSIVEGVIILLAVIALAFPALLTRPSRERISLRFAALAIGTVSVVLGAIMLTPSYTEAHETAGHSHGGTAEASSTPTPCELSGPPASPGQVATDAEGHSHRGSTPQVELTRDERVLLKSQQELARTVVTKYPTVADALAAGYQKSTAYVPCIGAHYTNARLAASFDLAKPSELLFDGTNPDSKLVGLSYLVFHPGGAPEGFAGPNDVWHQHISNGGLCSKGGLVIGGEAMSVEDCTALGGRKSANKDVWMMHDWIVPGWECSWGVFAGECPEGTAWDAPAPGSVGAQLAAPN